MRPFVFLALMSATIGRVAGTPVVGRGIVDRSPVRICPDNEMWMDCGACDRTCANLHPVCPLTHCLREGSCGCMEGLVREPVENRCVLLRECPIVEPPVDFPPPKPAELHQPQAELHRPQAELHRPQAELHQPQAELHPPQAELHQPQAELHQPQAELHRPQAELHRPQAELHQPQAELHPPQAELHQPQAELHPPAIAEIHPPKPDVIPLPECPDKETWLPCGACDGTCFEMQPICSRFCQPKGGCGCIKDHVREPKGPRCIPKSECPKVELVDVQPRQPVPVHPPVCPDKEQWFPCGACDKTCSELQPICSKICQSRGSCGCIKDHVREPKGHECIHVSNCAA